MNTALNMTKSPRREMTNRLHRPLVGEREREAALEKLLSLLEAGTPDAHTSPVFDAEAEANALHRLSRLRAAHAVYALKTGGMVRVGTGAWMRRRSQTSKLTVPH